MQRRGFLSSLLVAGLGACAGCSSSEDSPSSPSTTHSPTVTSTPRENPDTLFVAPDGADANPGTKPQPLQTIQEGFNRAQPGMTIHALPGRYQDRVETVRPGTPEDPIVLTGSPDAVFVGGDETPLPEPLKVLHSHIHVLGLTFDGLQNPDKPDVVSKDAPNGSSYAGGNIQVNPFSRDGSDTFPGYVRDIKIKPHAVGNVLGAMINVFFCHDVEIGEFRVIGPGGLQHLKGDREGHNGEVVYIGTPPDKFGGTGTNISGATVDESSNIHVHHILNDAGHPHAELVDVKAGCTDVTVEYCTDRGGAGRYVLPGHDATSETAFHLGGNDSTLRWCIVEDSHGQAVEIGSWGAANPEDFEEGKGFPLPDAVADAGRNNAVHGNRFRNHAGLAVRYPRADGEIPEAFGPSAQRAICGNVIDGETDGDPTQACPDSLPDAATIGHLGGDSPYA